MRIAELDRGEEEKKKRRERWDSSERTELAQWKDRGASVIACANTSYLV